MKLMMNMLGERAYGFAFALVIAVIHFHAPALCAQDSPNAGAMSYSDPVTASAGTSDSMFNHSDDSRFWVSGQANFIYQTTPPFHADYTGANSLLPNYEKAISRVLSLYTGVRLNASTEVVATIEEAGGSGLSQALGVAGFPNLDVVRNPTLSKDPYLARVMFHKVIALGGDKVEADRGPLSTFSELPARRLELRVGKFDTVDFFDQNAVGSDSHFQFMNWSTAENGAYDYAADTRGYTWGAVVEYQTKRYALRAGEMLMPKVANGMDMVWDVRKARAENVEFELRKGLLPKREGTVRLLSFVNHANMGIYRDAVAQYEVGATPVPDITAHPWKTTVKYGFGVNFEQALSQNFKAFARWGWNNGKTESFVYTEIDSTFSCGIGADGHKWHRNRDRAGVAFASNAISKDHQNYLADGGMGFIIGDGALNYGRENIVESYYTAHVWRGLFLGPDLQHVNNPAYNRDRGPVLIPGFRVHVEL
jgi:high affinity Mn2+ porin